MQMILSSEDNGPRCWDWESFLSVCEDKVILVLKKHECYIIILVPLISEAPAGAGADEEAEHCIA